MVAEGTDLLFIIKSTSDVLPRGVNLE